MAIVHSQPTQLRSAFYLQYFVMQELIKPFCNNSLLQSLDTIYLLGVTTAVQSVTWSTSGSGTFGNANAAQTYYALSPADKANGYMVDHIRRSGRAMCCS